jgi:hypothetical protein
VVAEAGRPWVEGAGGDDGSGWVEKRREKREIFPRNARNALVWGEGGSVILQLPLRYLMEASGGQEQGRRLGPVKGQI